MRVRRIPAGTGRSTAIVVVASAAALLLAAGVSYTPSPAALPPVAPPLASRDLGPPPPEPPSAGPRPGQPVMGGVGWRVVAARSVQGVLIVEVEAAGTPGGADLAARIIDPARADHVEALVYFRRAGESLADTRVQWTPSGGYVTLALR